LTALFSDVRCCCSFRDVASGTSAPLTFKFPVPSSPCSLFPQYTHFWITVSFTFWILPTSFLNTFQSLCGWPHPYCSMVHTQQPFQLINFSIYHQLFFFQNRLLASVLICSLYSILPNKNLCPIWSLVSLFFCVCVF
jgi:hypothetical protein